MEHDPTDTAGRERNLQDAAKDGRKKEAELVAALKWIVSNARGRLWLTDLLDKTGVFASCFTGNSETIYREGRRDIGLEIVQQIMKHPPATFAQLIEEKATNGRSSSSN